MRPSPIPTHSMGRSQRSRCAGLMSGSIERTASVQSSSIRVCLAGCPQGWAWKIHHGIGGLHVAFPSLSTADGTRDHPLLHGCPGSPSYVAPASVCVASVCLVVCCAEIRLRGPREARESLSERFEYHQG